VGRSEGPSTLKFATEQLGRREGNLGEAQGRPKDAKIVPGRASTTGVLLPPLMLACPGANLRVLWPFIAPQWCCLPLCSFVLVQV